MSCPVGILSDGADLMDTFDKGGLLTTSELVSVGMQRAYLDIYGILGCERHSCKIFSPSYMEVTSFSN